jgi:hypothetical protein
MHHLHKPSDTLQIGAAQTITSGLANGLLTNAVVMREKLPKVGALFGDGLISYLLVRTICTLTALVKDPDARRRLDAALAAELLGWGAKSVDQIDRDINTIIARHDPYAVRRMQDSARTHHAKVVTEGDTAYVTATVTSTDGMAFDQRADRLARTVCPRDPRTLDQRRGAAVGAMGFGWDRLPCLCESPDCEAASTPPVGGVVIHVIAGADALDLPGERGAQPEPPAPTPVEPDPEDGFEPPPDDDRDDEGNSDTESGCTAGDSRTEATATPEQTPSQTRPAPAVPVGDLTAQRRALVGKPPPGARMADYTTWEDYFAALAAERHEFCPARPGVILGGGVLPGPVLAHLAMTATIRPLVHPGDAAPEPRYRPSQKLANFVRARDLTCRFPGCTRAATRCQLDHVTPYPYGPTAASNLACLCVEHHLLKTFWPGWTYTLQPDGTAHWRDPDGQTSTSHPGSRLLFPELSNPVAKAVITETPPPKHTAGLTMPRRTITRKQAREKRIDAERAANTQWAEQYLRDEIPPF